MSALYRQLCIPVLFVVYILSICESEYKTSEFVLALDSTDIFVVTVSFSYLLITLS